MPSNNVFSDLEEANWFGMGEKRMRVSELNFLVGRGAVELLVVHLV